MKIQMRGESQNFSRDGCGVIGVKGFITSFSL